MFPSKLAFLVVVVSLLAIGANPAQGLASGHLASLHVAAGIDTNRIGYVVNAVGTSPSGQLPGQYFGDNRPRPFSAAYVDNNGTPALTDDFIVLTPAPILSETITLLPAAGRRFHRVQVRIEQGVVGYGNVESISGCPAGSICAGITSYVNLPDTTTPIIGEIEIGTPIAFDIFDGAAETMINSRMGAGTTVWLMSRSSNNAMCGHADECFGGGEFPEDVLTGPPDFLDRNDTSIRIVHNGVVVVFSNTVTPFHGPHTFEKYRMEIRDRNGQMVGEPADLSLAHISVDSRFLMVGLPLQFFSTDELDAMDGQVIALTFIDRGLERILLRTPGGEIGVQVFTGIIVLITVAVCTFALPMPVMLKGFLMLVGMLVGIQLPLIVGVGNPWFAGGSLLIFALASAATFFLGKDG